MLITSSKFLLPSQFTKSTFELPLNPHGGWVVVGHTDTESLVVRCLKSTYFIDNSSLKLEPSNLIVLAERGRPGVMEAVDLSRLSTARLGARHMPALTSPPPLYSPSTLHTDQAEQTQHNPGLQLMSGVTVFTGSQEITDVTQFGEPRRGDMSGDIWDTCDPPQFG